MLGKQWDRQPTRLVPVREGLDLVLAYVGSLNADLAFREPSFGAAGAFLNTAAGGVGAANGGASDYHGLANQATNRLVTSGATFIAFGRTSNATTQQSIVAKTTGSGGSATPFDFTVVSGAPALGRANAGFRVWRSTTTGQIANNTDFIIAARTNGNDISTAPSFWTNGVKDSGATNLFGGSGSGTATTNANVVRIGNREDLGAPLLTNSFIYGIWVFAREMPDAFIQKATATRAGFWNAGLAPQRVWVPVSAAAASINGPLIGGHLINRGPLIGGRLVA